jgi:hypothetical protein
MDSVERAEEKTYISSCPLGSNCYATDRQSCRIYEEMENEDYFEKDTDFSLS